MDAVSLTEAAAAGWWTRPRPGRTSCAAGLQACGDELEAGGCPAPLEARGGRARARGAAAVRLASRVGSSWAAGAGAEQADAVTASRGRAPGCVVAGPNAVARCWASARGRYCEQARPAADVIASRRAPLPPRMPSRLASKRGTGTSLVGRTMVGHGASLNSGTPASHLCSSCGTAQLWPLRMAGRGKKMSRALPHRKLDPPN